MNKALSIFLCFAVWHMGIILQQRRYQQLLLKVLLCFHGFARKESHSFPLVSWTDFTVFPSIISISGKLKRLAMQLGFPKRDRGGYGVHIFVSSKLAIRLADFLQILVNSTGCAQKNKQLFLFWPRLGGFDMGGIPSVHLELNCTGGLAKAFP